MKRQLFRLTLLLLFMPLVIFANDKKKFKHEKTKIIKKEFAVNADALLKINNRYGNIDIITWNENRVVIEVKITTKGNDEERVEDRLDDITIVFESSRSEVSAKTIIEKTSNYSNWFSWGTNKNVQYKINYTVKAPIANRVNLTNDYGNISLNELKGDAYINCDYGRIDIGDLYSYNNVIDINYTSNSTIGLINGGKINADYSKFTVEKARQIQLNADYTTSVFENVKALNYDCNYGSLKVYKAASVIGDGDYLSTRLGIILKKVKIDADYGSIRIEDLVDGFQSIDIDSDYTSVKIGIPSTAFDFEIKLSYGSFKRGENNLEFIKQLVKSSSKYYQGYFKNKNSGASIKIDSDYGSVTFQ